MGNTFKSLVAAAGILAAGGTNSKAEGWLDTRVEKTKQALVELIGSLDPVAYGKAIEVLQGDLGLLTDGRLDSTDEPTIWDHMTKLAKLFPEETNKVLKAMNEVDTIVAADQVAALNEGPKEKKEREERERIFKMTEKSAENLNDNFLEDRNWKFSSQNTLTAKIKRNWRSLEIEWDEKNVNPTHEAKVDLITVLAPGNYDIVMTIQSWSPLSLYIYDAGWKPLDMDGNIVPAGAKKSIAEFVSGVKTSISIPGNCRSCMFQGKVTTQDRKLIISDFVATGAPENDLAQK